MSVSRISMLRLVLILPVLALSLWACSTKLHLAVDQNGNVSGTVDVTFGSGQHSASATSIFQTREVDPSLLANNGSFPHSATLILTLDDGTTVSYSDSLYYDSTTSVTPVNSSHIALVYRPGNPGALQNFLNQYLSRTVSGRVVSTVGLRNISSGSTSTTVDVQSAVDGEMQYVGTGSVTLPSGGGPFQKDL